jgi:hypothetical protein
VNANKVKAGKARAAQFTPEYQAAAARALVEQRGVNHMRAIAGAGPRRFTSATTGAQPARAGGRW